MFAERQYWHDVADRFVKENVTVKPNRGNILSSDGKLMASSLPEYKIYMDFMSGERDEKRRKKDQQRKDSIWKANFDSICIGLHQDILVVSRISTNSIDTFFINFISIC